jgi:hypothetical protein
MSFATSRRSCCCSGESSLDTKFAVTLRMPRSSVKILFAEPQRIPTSLETTVLHDQCPDLVSDISISARWWSPGTLVSVRRYAAIFKAVEPLFSFCLGIPKFLTQLDAVSLLEALCHLERNENGAPQPVTGIALPFYLLYHTKNHRGILIARATVDLTWRGWCECNAVYIWGRKSFRSSAEMPSFLSGVSWNYSVSSGKCRRISRIGHNATYLGVRNYWRVVDLWMGSLPTCIHHSELHFTGHWHI